jgi:hypothetical protein
VAYQRWYDTDLRLSAVVRSLELLNEQSLEYFAEKLLEISESLLSEHGGADYLESLDPRKKAGLEKAQTNRKRWYDRQENLHKAFNNLYALTPKDRREVASRLTTPILIVEAYERYCRQEEVTPDIRVIEEILRTCLLEGHERAKRLYSLYMNDFSKMLPKSQAEETQEGFWTGLLKNIQSILAPA